MNNKVNISSDNISIYRIEEKCLNCGMCLKTCKSINNIGNDCINCGQCILTCPSGALVPKYDYKKVLNYINDTDYCVVAFTAPAVRVAIGDEFNYAPGTFLEGKMVSALKKIGFDYCFDATFGADLTVMEESYELIEKLKRKEKPLFTSCCPSWVKYFKTYHEKDINNLSTCKSPLSMEATMIKTYFKDMYNLEKDKIITVSIVPCVAKKYERKLYPETDFALTTKELAMMIRETNIDFESLKDKEFDKLLGSSSSSGLIFGASGGVTEAVLRTAYYMLNGKKAPAKFYHFDEIRQEQDFKTATIDLQKYYVKVAVVNKISTVKEKYDLLKQYDFVEVMACPGGCIGGGGQPLQSIKNSKQIRESRIDSIYNKDNESNIKESFMNPLIQDAYISYISKNNVELHTKCEDLEKIKE